MQSLFAHISLAVHQYETEFGIKPNFDDNRTLAAALTGNNPKQIIFLETELDQFGQIIDKWGTPIQVVRPSNKPLSFLSAGKDTVFGTSDDISDKK